MIKTKANDLLTPSSASVCYTPPPTPRTRPQCFSCLEPFALRLFVPKADRDHTDTDTREEFSSPARKESALVTPESRYPGTRDGYSHGLRLQQKKGLSSTETAISCVLAAPEWDRKPRTFKNHKLPEVLVKVPPLHSEY